MGAPVRPSAAVDTPAKFASLDEVSGEFYLRMEVPDQSGVLASIASDLASEGISIELLQQRKTRHKGQGVAAFDDSRHDRSAVKRACKKLRDARYVCDEPFVLRIWRGE